MTGDRRGEGTGDRRGEVTGGRRGDGTGDRMGEVTGDRRGDFGVPVEPTLGCDPLQKKRGQGTGDRWDMRRPRRGNAQGEQR